MRGDLGQPRLLWQRSAILLAVHRERTHNITLGGENRGRPTSAQSANLCQLAIISPKRVGHHIRHNDWPSRIHGSATRTIAWSDRRAVHRFHISLRQIRRRAVTHLFAIAVEEKNGTSPSFRLTFHEENKAG